MGVDILKKLKKEAKARQERGDSGVSTTVSAPSYSSGHKYFMSSNWKNLLERRPTIAPKVVAAAQAAGTRDDGAAPNVVALDCEMVGVGPNGTRSVLARVSIVDHEGRVLLDKFVRPSEKVTDYRTHVTGITAATLEGKGVLKDEIARKQAADLLYGKIVVGHSVNCDFEALVLDHPHALIRDTAAFRPLRPQGRERKTPSLATLAEVWLHQSIRASGVHDSVEDARIALRLYRLKSRQWEKQLKSVMCKYGGEGTTPLPVAEGEDEDVGEPVDHEDIGVRNAPADEAAAPASSTTASAVQGNGGGNQNLGAKKRRSIKRKTQAAAEDALTQGKRKRKRKASTI